jgi:hypothetical protein
MDTRSYRSYFSVSSYFLQVAYQVQQHVGDSFTASDLLVKGNIKLNVWYTYIGCTLLALRINWIRMKREQFIVRRYNWNFYYLCSLVRFRFGLYHRRFYNSEIIQNIGRESELNHPIYYVMGLTDTEFRLQVREWLIRSWQILNVPNVYCLMRHIIQPHSSQNPTTKFCRNSSF